MFTPGETALHSFVIPFKKQEVNNILVSYKQQEDIILEVPITSGQIRDVYEDNEYLHSVFDVILTQRQSLLFQEYQFNCNSYKVQLNVLLNSGARFTSEPMARKNGTQYYREVMGNG